MERHTMLMNKNTVKMSVLPTRSTDHNIIPVKIPAGFLVKTDKIILKFT